ncbi:MAG: hypothetical protein Q7R32_08370 [Dehalococcoidia bacterium]|nr:hypothetical protein [Dehalococcoidia bacterium]
MHPRKVALRLIASVAVAAGVASFFGTAGGGGGGDSATNHVAAGTEGPTVTSYFTYCSDFGCYPFWPVQWHIWGKTNGTAVNDSVYQQWYLEHGVYVEGLYDLPDEFGGNLVGANQTDVTHGQQGQRQTTYNISAPVLCTPTLISGGDASWCKSTSAVALYTYPSYKTTGFLACVDVCASFPGQTEVGYLPLD